MKRFLLFLLTIGFFTGVSAQSEAVFSKMNPAGIALMSKYQKALKSRANGNYSDSESVPEEVSVLLSLNAGYTEGEIAKIPGVTIHNPGKKILLVSLPLNEVDKLAASPATKKISFGEKAKALMNKARPASEVTEVQNGLSNNLPQSYSGNGVILGMMDTGLDPNHINFMNNDLTANRIKQVWYYPSSSASAMKSYSTPSEIASFTTDNDNETHGTHVAGIMGGSYDGTAEVAILNEQTFRTTVQKSSIPFYGVAPEAEMALGCGSLQTTNIASALENFVNYCKGQNKPGAFNISLGINYGPHDGTSEICQFISQYTDDVVVVIAAGNEGNEPISIQKTFSSTTDKLQTVLYSGEDEISGLVDLWSSNSTIFTTTFGLYDTKSQSLVYSYSVTPPTAQPNSNVVIYGTGGNPDIDTKGYTKVTSDEFSSTFSNDSYIGIYTLIDGSNNRFNSWLDVNLDYNNGNSNIVPALILSGPANLSVNGYAQSSETSLYFKGTGASGWTEGNANGSLNDLACADGVISVGSYVSKNIWPILSGNALVYGQDQTTNQILPETGTVSSFSSYSTLPSGQTLPVICAPGQGVVSSFSTYYMNQYADETYSGSMTYGDAASADLDRSTLTNGAKANRTDWWFLIQGTSMAAPYVTGVSALLLEANPTLTSPQVRDILTGTADYPSGQTLTSTEKLQWGAGRVNALNAMRGVLDSSGIGDLYSDSNTPITIEQTDSELTAYLSGEHGLTAHLYSIGGYSVATANGSGESVTLNISGLQKGIYILTLEPSAGGKISRRVLIGQQ